MSNEMDLAPFDVAELLDSPELMVEYLNQALAENDSAFLLSALGDVARARGMGKVSEASGVSRSALYRALSAEGRTEFDTVSRVVRAMGLQLRIESAPAAA